MKAITIVTVCYNEEKNIARTIESVLMQTAVNFEYIICDGLSKDRTVEIAQSYQDAFAQKGITYRICSEKDNGIYDAMNKGIDKAEGKYIWFLNAADWLCDVDAVKRFAACVERDSSPAVYYADYYHVDDHQRLLCVCNADELKRFMSIGHPSMITRTDLMRERKFDTNYRLAADYNFILGLKMDDLEFCRLGFPATYFLAGGISTTNKQLQEEELERIHAFYGLPHEKSIEQAPSFIRSVLSKVLRIAPMPLRKFWHVKIKHRPWVEY